MGRGGGDPLYLDPRMYRLSCDSIILPVIYFTVFYIYALCGVDYNTELSSRMQHEHVITLVVNCFVIAFLKKKHKCIIPCLLIPAREPLWVGLIRQRCAWHASSNTKTPKTLTAIARDMLMMFPCPEKNNHVTITWVRVQHRGKDRFINYMYTFW